MNARGTHVNTISNGKLAEDHSGGVLWSVNINKAAAGGILNIYNGTSIVAADLLASIDCGTVGSLWYGIYCPKGIFYDLTVAAADVTIGIA